MKCLFLVCVLALSGCHKFERAATPTVPVDSVYATMHWSPEEVEAKIKAAEGEGWTVYYKKKVGSTYVVSLKSHRAWK